MRGHGRFRPKNVPIQLPPDIRVGKFKVFNKVPVNKKKRELGPSDLYGKQRVFTFSDCAANKHKVN